MGARACPARVLSWNTFYGEAIAQLLYVLAGKTSYSCLVKQDAVAQKCQNEKGLFLCVCVCPVTADVHAHFDSHKDAQ